MRLLQVARLSRSHDASTGLDKQDSKVTAYARAYDHQIIGVAADDGVSGKTDPFGRPALGQWLTDPRLMAQYDGIIASHLDRLARSTRYIGKLLDWAAEHGKTVICVEPAVDFSTPAGKLIAFIIGWLAEQELELITARSKDTQDMLKASGYLVGRPTYGFITVGKDDHRTLAPEPREAGFVRQAAAMYLTGASLRQVCAWLDEQGAKPHHGGPWSPVSLRQVFRNESLIGRRTDAAGKTVLKHEAIVSRETWDALQAELSRKGNRKGIAPATTAMLTGVAHCSKCSGPMYRINGSYLRCHGNDRAPSRCKNMIPIASLEGWLDQKMADNGGYVIETVVKPGAGHEDAIADVERDLRELDWDAPDFADRQAALLAERARLKALPATPAEVREEVAGYTVAELWASLDTAQRRQYLLDCGVKIFAAGRDPEGWRIAGDTSHAARGGWSELVVTEDLPGGAPGHRGC